MTIKLLEELFSSKVRSKLLNLFFMNPKNEYYLRQIESLINMSIRPIQLELERLVRLNILISYKDGNRRYFKLNNNHYLYQELKNIVLKTTGIAELIRELLTNFDNSLQFAFIYGSYAKGTESVTSDIDVCIIGSVSTKNIYENIGKQKELTSREININVYSASEFKIKYSEKHHFISELVNTEKIFIIGQEDGFKLFIESG